MQELNRMEDFQRDITYRVLRQDDGTAKLTALMLDRFHDVELEVRVNAVTLEILAAKVEFRKCPSAYCPNVSERLDGMVGFVIGRGLNKKVREVLGGSHGCGNLRNLLLGLLPLALNMRASAGLVDEDEMLEAMQAQLRGSCAGFVDDETAPSAVGAIR